ncbi:PadR family transcriptional regulator [Nocardia sp. NPDC019395]|uniref:PadR family transcriptional regulator n=1 Tax=Nocardia sp. NPDC019395 TaxID=3154686 RepID=UPI0033F2C440
MSLRHGILGLLGEMGAASGYDLLKMFDISLAHVWPATQSQLYTELGKLAGEELIDVVAEGARGRKEYRITEAGREELRHWLVDVAPKRPQRDEALLRVFFLGQVDSDRACHYLLNGADHLDQRLNRLLEDERSVALGDDDLSRYGRLVMDYGKRFMAMRRDWLRDAAAEIREHTQRTEVAGSVRQDESGPRESL